MPELPEVETVRRGLSPAMEGRRFVRVEVRRGDLRWPLPRGFAQRLHGKTVEGLGRRAKYLLADLSSGDVLLMHLGMSGSFRVGKDRAPGNYHHKRSNSRAHDHVVFHMSNGATVTFNDPRRFGSMKLVSRAKLEQEPLLRALGPEPLGNEFDAAMLAKACAGKRTSLKAALSDQRVVAGLGNIYVCEALFRARLSPLRSASTIVDRHGKPTERAERLVNAIKAVLLDAIGAGGSSLRDHRKADGSLGDFQHNFQVYDREGQPCPSCKGKIKRIVQLGRSTFYCPSCQR
ncbi:MAG TPA: bifunctional DNA-formamidopyrimidine glycosylase/DNA-(apurinic or apyrimidinic site) lyase [Pseudolabrys sp.]|nr:bifunctional DNA-formamidopyrimidine glycosylase/DNA-(apurinic or apyrimidinic site) lyase [Pseudolabrys sp.]